MFNCVVCGNNIAESKRIFECLDWCPDCIGKDGRLLSRESRKDNFNPSLRLPNMPEPLKVYQSQRERYFTSRPPYYHIYRNQVPENIKQKIRKEK